MAFTWGTKPKSMKKTIDRPLNHLLMALGPGLIFAGTSIGVSHLVQSTQAGAKYGFGLLMVIVIVHLCKFPFFEIGPRYTVATGEHLLKGYRRLGRGVFYLYFLLSLLTMFPIQAGVTLVATGLLVNLFQWPFEPVLLSAILLLVCVIILAAGKYPLLDRLMKIMIIFLGLSTILAFVAAMLKGSQAQPQLLTSFDWANPKDITFLIAFMGWMPTTLEITVWHSFWCAERIRQTGQQPNMRAALSDFHIGYWGTMVMAIFFLGLGALTMYATGESFSPSAVKFTGQVVDLYTQALGPWSRWIIAVAAATTMFSTTLCCLDAFPRVIREALIMMNPGLEQKKDQIYNGAMILIAIISTVIIGCFVTKMKTLIDFATIMAFLATPVFALINLRTILQSHVPVEFRPSKVQVIYSWICLVLLIAFGLFFLYSRFLMN